MTATTKATQWLKTAQMPTRGGSIATNIVDDDWGCKFLRVATKAISNGEGDTDDNLKNDATTNIFSDGIRMDKGGTFNNQQGQEVATEVRQVGAGGR
jgi:hypothetical protein